MSNYPRIAKAGDDPNCVHREDIVGQVGTCITCGQVKEYAPPWLTDNRPDHLKMASMRGAKPGVSRKQAGEGEPRFNGHRPEATRRPGRPKGSKDREPR